jgi:uncharacterized protein with von Willebrand factor type A (vWA) domain
VAAQSVALTDELLSWLSEAKTRRELSPEELAQIEELDLEEVLKRFRERLREQKERHDGGSHWIGTGGTSPFGRGGFHPSGIRVGPPGGGMGGALRNAQARRYRGYRGDVTLDTRQMEVALRKLRGFGREGGRPELDVEATIAATARNAGELELVLAPPRRPNTRVILLMDVGGSMDPYAELVSQLFSAARRATHWKELRTYYFHNCVYDLVYRSERFEDPLSLEQLLRECDDRYHLVFLGDADMAPYELHGAFARRGQQARTGLDSLLALRRHFTRACWLNPEGGREGERFGTCAEIGAVFPMFPLTLDGLGEAVATLTRGSPHRL